MKNIKDLIILQSNNTVLSESRFHLDVAATNITNPKANIDEMKY